MQTQTNFQEFLNHYIQLLLKNKNCPSNAINIIACDVQILKHKIKHSKKVLKNHNEHLKELFEKSIAKMTNEVRVLENLIKK